MIVADRIPAADGLNCTVITQLAPGAIVAPAEQEFTDATNSAFEMLRAAMLSGPLPVLVTVTVWLGAHVPTAALANVTTADDGVATGAPTTTAAPVPASNTLLVAGVAL